MTPGETIAQSAGEQSASESRLVPGEEVVHWSRLPLWGAEEARQEGFELPLPLGISTNYYTEKQDFHMPKLKLGWGDAGLLDVGSLVHVSNIETEQSTWNARFDSWILPFLNLYAIAGYVDGQAEIELRPGMLPFFNRHGPKLDIKLEYEGPMVALGGTVAAGFRPIKDRPTIVYGQTDLTFSRTMLDFNQLVDSLDTVDVMVLGTRVGVRERIVEDSPVGDVHLSLWGGAMYQGVQEVMTGRLGILDLNFRAEVEAVNPWNTIVGGRVEIGKSFDLMVEVGLGERESLIVAATYRF